MASKKEKEFIQNLELALANMVNNNAPSKYIKAWGWVIEQLQKGYSVVAVLEAENLGLDKELVSGIRKVFDVRWVVAAPLFLSFWFF